MSTHYSLVEFTVTWYKAGEKVYDDPLLWEGESEWGVFPEDGEWITVKNDFIHNIRTGNYDKRTVELFVPNKDMVAIVGLTVFEEGPLHFEYDAIGTEAFQEWEKDIIDLAKTLPEPKKNETKWKTFLTLWKCTVSVSRGWEDLYDDYEMYPELVGIVEQDHLKQLEGMVGIRNV